VKAGRTLTLTVSGAPVPAGRGEGLESSSDGTHSVVAGVPPPRPHAHAHSSRRSHCQLSLFVTSLVFVDCSSWEMCMSNRPAKSDTATAANGVAFSGITVCAELRNGLDTWSRCSVGDWPPFSLPSTSSLPRTHEEAQDAAVLSRAQQLAQVVDASVGGALLLSACMSCGSPRHLQRARRPRQSSCSRASPRGWRAGWRGRGLMRVWQQVCRHSAGRQARGGMWNARRAGPHAVVWCA